MPLSPGQDLSHYTILGSLGVGAMGEVYRAHDTRLGRAVAIKVLPERFAEEEERLRRFEHEAKSLARLNHPNVAQIFGVDQIDDTSFLVLEFVDGETLEDRLERGPLALAEALDVCRQICEGVGAAHEAGIVHRDLKPANVRITPRGVVKVLDFGIAKSASVNSAADSVLLTEAGRVLGTPSYMAPEQARGAPIDGRIDVWAIGCLLFECLAARRAFEGDSLVNVLVGVFERQPDWDALPAGTPLRVRELIESCLRKEPARRLESVAALLRQLDGTAPGASDRAFFKPPRPAPTPLLGREPDLRRGLEHVQAGARLLTVTGYGGTGKTRFSMELFDRLAPAYEGGAAFVSLASVTSAPAVLRTVGVSLDIAEAHGRSALEALEAVIAHRPALLVLDNLEQVLDAADDIAMLVERCPRLQVIATSRAPLKVGAETEFALPPLALPGEKVAAPEELLAAPAIALFVERARKVRPGFELDGDNATSVVAICRRLDGLPLAIELAAARVRILEPAALLSRLDHALDLLTSGDRDLPLRQRTLRTTISWSYSLLDADEQRTLRGLSVFHEGWTLEAMERVLFGEEDGYRAIDHLDSLVEKGLVRVVGKGERYALLETVRAFGTEQLHAGGEVEAVRAAHADYFLSFAEGVRAGFLGTDQRAAVQRALADNANTLAALEWLTSEARSGDEEALEKGLLFCGYLDWYWHVRGHHYTARVFLDELLARAKDRPPSRGRALAWLAAGMVATTTDEWERSLREWSAGHDDAVAVGDEPAAAEGAMGTGYCLLSLGRMDEALASLDEGIARGADGVSDFMHAISMAIKGMLLFATGKLDEGIALEKAALPIQQRIGDNEGGGMTLSFLAQMTFASGDLEGALALYRQALAAFETCGDRPEAARVLCETGWTALEARALDEARDAFRRAVHVNEEVGSPRGTGQALLGFAAIEAAEGRPGRAVSIAGAAQALSERAGVVVAHPMVPDVAERIQALKASIPADELDGLLREARSLSPADVLALVFDE